MGRADGTCIPAPEPALDAKVPEDSDMKGKFGPRTKDSIDKANELLNNFSNEKTTDNQRSISSSNIIPNKSSISSSISDIEYIENWSLFLDLKIIFKTPFSLFNKKVKGI